MPHRIFGTLLLVFASLASFSQINIQWESRLDGTGSYIDKAVDLELDSEGNTYVTGASYSGTSFEIVTVKYDPDGVELWRSNFDGLGIDESRALALDSNDDVIVTGSTFIGGSDWDIVTIKYDGVTGAELWNVIEAGSSDFDSGKDIMVDGSDNIVVVGDINSAPFDVDFMVLKYDTDGVLIWSDINGGGGSDNAKLVQIDDSDNIYVGGHEENSVGSTFFDFKLVKYTSLGVVEWFVSEDSDFDKLDTPFAMDIDGAGNIVMAGSGFTDILNEEDYLTIKFSAATGEVLWKNLYAGDAEGLDVVNAVAIDGANNVYVTGKSKSLATSEDYYTIAYDPSGTEIWSDRYTTDGLGYDEGRDIRVSSSDLSVYVTGYSFYSVSNNDFTTIKYDVTDGTPLWTTIFDGPSSNSDQALKMMLDPTDNIYITGNSHGGTTNLDFSTIKYCQLTTEASPDTAICEGGSVDLVATGGDDVTWEVLTGDAGSMSCTLCETMTATPTESTVYIVSSTSLSGCIDYDTVAVTVNPIPSVEIYNDTPLDFCFGNSVVLYTDEFASYEWSTGEVSETIEVTATETVSLTIVDTNLCSNMATVDVVVYDLPIVEVGDDVSVCPGASVPLNATGAVTYSWDADPTLSSLLIPNPVASPIVDTEYKVSGTDLNGCVSRDSVNVFIYELPAVNAGADETICIGDSVQLLATGATTYEWDFSISLSDLDIADPWATPSVLTEYFVIGTDDNGCSNRDSINVSTLSLPTINAGMDTSVCLGLSVDLFATGGLFDLYVWNEDATLSETDVFDPVASPTVTTEYIVEGTDVNGCSNFDSVIVEIYALPLVSAGDDEDICFGETVPLNASGAISYVWNSDPSLSDLGIPNPIAGPVSTKTYTVTGVDINGCENEDDVVVIVHEFPDVSAGSDVEICLGDSTQLNATGGIIYVWDFDATLSNFLIGDPWAKPTVTTTYIVEGTDAFGCSNIDEVIVTVNPLPVVPVLSVEGAFIVSSTTAGNQWYHDGVLLTGETNDSLNYVDFGMNGEFWVVITNENGCVSESDRILNPIFITDVGIAENAGLLDVRLYPNPTTGVLNINFDQQIDLVTVFTLDGKEVILLGVTAPGINQVDMRDLPRGTYLIQLIKDDQVIIRKVIKQ